MQIHRGPHLAQRGAFCSKVGSKRHCGSLLNGMSFPQTGLLALYFSVTRVLVGKKRTERFVKIKKNENAANCKTHLLRSPLCFLAQSSGAKRRFEEGDCQEITSFQGKSLGNYRESR